MQQREWRRKMNRRKRRRKMNRRKRREQEGRKRIYQRKLGEEIGRAIQHCGR